MSCIALLGHTLGRARAPSELTLHATLANNSGQIIPSSDAIRRFVSRARRAPGFYID